MSTANARREELGLCIRSLTSILRGFMLRKSPSRHKDIPPFLRHFTTLLTCDDPYEKQAKTVVAVAGSISPGQHLRALIVAQNPYLGSSMEKVRLTMVEKDDRQLEEVMVGKPNPPLAQHIADVLTALSTFDARATNINDQTESLEVFFLTRSLRTFEVRFREDSKLCGGKRLHEVIMGWQADPKFSELTPKWVNPPAWPRRLPQISEINSRVVEGVLQWEFSDETKRAWSTILVGILRSVDKGIDNVKAAGAKKEAEVRRAMKKLNRASGFLYYFVCWEAGVVKSLLTQTNMVYSIATAFVPPSSDEASDDLADLYREPEESKGHQIFRYLRMVTAWHAAVNNLCNLALPEFLKNVETGLVEVSPSPSSVLSLEEISHEFFSRFPGMQENRQAILDLIKSKYPPTFSGCVHAEATLMGLLNCYRPGSTHLNYDAELQNPGALQRIVQPMADAGDAVIAVSEKCCWCCDWLGRNLETQFILPGTHGILFPWDPPKVGISVSVLEKLEQELWKKVHDVIVNHLQPSYSRQNSLLGSPAMPPKDRVADDSDISDLVENIPP